MPLSSPAKRQQSQSESKSVEDTKPSKKPAYFKEEISPEIDRRIDGLKVSAKEIVRAAKLHSYQVKSHMLIFEIGC